MVTLCPVHLLFVCNEVSFLPNWGPFNITWTSVCLLPNVLPRRGGDWSDRNEEEMMASVS